MKPTLTQRDRNKGYFKPKNPHKYRGKSKGEIIYRSSWERKLMMKCDTHPSIIWWSSEELHVPYVSPKDGRIHRYFRRFYYWIKGF